MQEVYLIQNPAHPYGIRLINAAWKQHKIPAVAYYTNPKDGFYLKSEFPELQSDKVIENIGLRPHRFEEFAEYISGKYKVRAVFPWFETVMEESAQLIELLGVDWNSRQLLMLFRDKHKFKEHLLSKDQNFPITKSHSVKCLADINNIDQLPDRFVLKPTDGVANEDIGFFSSSSTDNEFNEYFANAKKFSNFILEELLVGDEYAINGQVDENGKCIIYSINRYERKAANGKPNMYYYTWNLRNNCEEFTELESYASKLMTLSGLVRCPFHMEVIIDDTLGPRLIEVGARLSGDHLVFTAEDIHNGGLDPFDMCAHYYLSKQNYSSAILNWDFTKDKSFVDVYGIAEKDIHIGNTTNFDRIENHPDFKRWVIKPKANSTINRTTTLDDVPYEFHLVRTGDDSTTRDLAKKLRENLFHPDPLNPFQLGIINTRRFFKKISKRMSWELGKNSFFFD